MKVHTTNYENTFIEVADDCPALTGVVPPDKAEAPSIASRQFDILIKHPYRYTSDDVIFRVYAERNEIPQGELKAAKEAFFSKGQPCLRASPLTKRYGWGVHSDKDGKVAIYARDSAEYGQFVKDATLNVVKAMRSKKQ